ncbi:hypothetical protein L6164_004434 [Bauhinia variegata]|uniref:Uncharacterized protein n=1 Tax=Bauhinia variegata TaxID=167791 RepID=A0ACB9Q4J8_BAUVA|nr:hypothetical protein L6164_004434 [Bauhinia variegata]
MEKEKLNMGSQEDTEFLTKILNQAHPAHSGIFHFQSLLPLRVGRLRNSTPSLSSSFPFPSLRALARSSSLQDRVRIYAS